MSIAAIAQELDGLFSRFVSLIQKKAYEKALKTGDTLLNQYRQYYGDTTADYNVLVGYQAVCYVKVKEYDKAEPLFTSALTHLKKIKGDQDEDYLMNLNSLSTLYEITNRDNKAEPILQWLIENARNRSGENSEACIDLLNRLESVYNKTKQFDKAESVLLQIVNMWGKIYGDSTAQYANNLNNLALFYKIRGLYEKAEPIYNKALSIIKNVVGENDSSYTKVLNNLAILYQDMGQYEKAETVFIKSMSISEKLMGINHPGYAKSLNNLGNLYKIMGLFNKAEPLLIESMNIRKKALGDNYPDYAGDLNTLAGLYENMGNYKKAEALSIESITIRKRELGVSNPDYANSLNTLAVIYKSMGLYEKAEPLNLESLAIYKEAFGENNPDYATNMNNLALLYQSMGDYDKAESLIILSAEIRKKVLGVNTPAYANSLNNLAILFNDRGQYEKAEPLFIESMNIRKKVLGENHPDYASSLNNFGILYRATGQYVKAEALYIESINICKKTTGENHPDYANGINALGILYSDMGEYEKAEPLLLQSITIRKNVLGENHPLYANSLNNLATLYIKMGYSKKAETLYILSMNINKKNLGENNLTFASSLNNLASLYNGLGQYEKAESLFIQSIEIKKKVLGINNLSYANSLDNLAGLYENMGQFEKAEPLILQNSEIVLQNLLNNFTVFSEKEKEAYIANRISMLETNNSHVYNFGKTASSILRNNFNQQLIFKSLTLSDTRNLLISLQQNTDTAVRQILKEWKINKNILSKQYALSLSDRRSDLKELETKTEQLEKELSSQSSGFRKQQNALRVSMSDIQKNLMQNEVAIEFVSFNLCNKKWTDSIIYAAYILHKNDSAPQFVPLCEEKQLGKYFSAAGAVATIKAIYRSDAVDEDDKPVISGDSLYALIWKPLLPYLNDVKKINYSPAGLLYKIAFHALPAGDSLLLMDKYELNQYISVRQLALQNDSRNIDKSITLFGDCRFTMDSTAIVNTMPANEKSNTLIRVNISRSKNAGGWKELPGTADEIKNIQTLFDKNRINTSVFMQVNATEEQFKSLSGNAPSVIHLATHGFFLPDPKKKRQEGFAADARNAFTLADDPLLRSGIVLSGANRVWMGQPPIEGRDDGIVTAYEIAQMNLRKTDLVVLSACETALGDIKGSGGVFGLQRAFKLAGVKNMLLSLWKVPDAETAELMKDFYTYYLQGKPVKDAFAAAQQEMRKKYKPYYWAAFVLIE